jgi:hypothetical protein
MRNTSRSMIVLCLLGCAACARQPPVAVKPESSREVRGIPFPRNLAERPDESRPGVGRFMLRIARTPQSDVPLYRMDGE